MRRRGGRGPIARQASHRPNSSSRWDVTVNAEPLADLGEHRGQARVLDVERPAAAGADRVVVVDGIAADVGVVAVGQVDALDEAEVGEHVEGAEDRRPPDPDAAPAARPSTRSAAVKWASRAATSAATVRRGSVSR